MDGVDLLVVEQVGVARIPPLDTIGGTDLIELLPRPLADGDELGMRMPLVDRDELGTEAEADDGSADGTRGLSRHDGATHWSERVTPCVVAPRPPQSP